MINNRMSAHCGACSWAQRSHWFEPDQIFWFRTGRSYREHMKSSPGCRDSVNEQLVADGSPFRWTPSGLEEVAA
jgi:hypothetical protein